MWYEVGFATCVGVNDNSPHRFIYFHMVPVDGTGTLRERLRAVALLEEMFFWP